MRYAQGDMSAASATLDSMPPTRRDAADYRTGIAAVQGRVSAARRMHIQAGTIAARSGAPVPPLLDTVAFGLLDVILGNRGRAVARLDAALGSGLLRAGAPIDRPYLKVATLYAQAGRADRARDVLRERMQAVRDTSLIRAETAELQRVMGEAALAEQRGRDAVTLFWRSDSLPDGPSWSCLRCTYALVARAYDAAGARDSAIVYLERYLQTPHLFAAASLVAYGDFEASPDPLYLAPAQERLAQLCEARGDIAKAVEHYRAFIDLWKNADNELQPRVAEARRRLARIATSLERLQ